MAESGAVPVSPDEPKPEAVAAAEVPRVRAADKGKLRVFISYSRVDHEFADQLQAALETCGFECDIDREDISGGEDWKNRLGMLITEADTVVFVLSPSSVASQICGWEVERSAELGKRILPVVCRSLAGVAPPPRLQSLNYIFFYADPDAPGSGFGQGLKLLVTALNTDFDWLRDHTRYLQRATEWDGGGRGSSRLLTGSDIAEAKAWVARRPRTAPEPTPLELDFIRASEAEELARSNAALRQAMEMQEANTEREAALREKEAAVEQAQAAQRMRARSEIFRNALLLVTVVLFFLTAATAIGALRSASTARSEREHAEALLASAKPIVASVQYKMDESGRAGAFGFFKEASRFGDPSSTGYVGVSYRNGWGVTRDYQKAVHFLESAAAEGDRNAMDNLGAIYDSGEGAEQGVARDFPKARDWYQKGADAGWVSAMVNLARLYNHARGVTSDAAKAREWYEKAAGQPAEAGQQGQQEAMFALGVLYDSGRGVGVDQAQAREWYKRAAEGGHSGAMVRLGAMSEGGAGVAQDFVEAIDWYTQAANQNDPQAMFRLGSLNQVGRGEPQDMAAAIAWYERAAAAGHPEAMQGLGQIYEKGASVAPDPVKARRWYDAAAKSAAPAADKQD
jgi:TPR repeat protein